MGFNNGPSAYDTLPLLGAAGVGYGFNQLSKKLNANMKLHNVDNSKDPSYTKNFVSNQEWRTRMDIVSTLVGAGLGARFGRMARNWKNGTETNEPPAKTPVNSPVNTPVEGVDAP